ncbi:serine hydrolase-domain-containing protein, partial [Fimicolochytrium jonesii]|uniref:serine hydrolase-domain-containing protein n=1 Tax=Fimicolochytrium jonesii TaxID=1396493 RepID=UPI0022FE2F04
MTAAVATAVVAAKAPLRILCLHGYTQNAEVFRKRLAVLRKDVKDTAELVFMSAPHDVAPEHLPPGFSQTESEGPKAWFRFKETAEIYEGIDDSLAAISSMWSSPSADLSATRFHGILGFSQGATMAAIALPQLEPKPLFSIHVSGFLPRDASWAGFLKERAAMLGGVPSLHVFGRADTWVPPFKSERLMHAPLRKGPQALVHDGGHFVPMGAAHRRLYKKFLGRISSQLTNPLGARAFSTSTTARQSDPPTFQQFATALANAKGGPNRSPTRRRPSSPPSPPTPYDPSLEPEDLPKSLTGVRQTHHIPGKFESAFRQDEADARRAQKQAALDRLIPPIHKTPALKPRAPDNRNLSPSPADDAPQLGKRQGRLATKIHTALTDLHTSALLPLHTHWSLARITPSASKRSVFVYYHILADSDVPPKEVEETLRMYQPAVRKLVMEKLGGNGRREFPALEFRR